MPDLISLNLVLEASTCSLSEGLRMSMQRPKLIPDEWQTVLDIPAKGEVLSGVIKSVNRGGVVVEVR